ncbi:MAG: hypothetical protein HYU52_11170 [Acidobacteria bacterium]|nr:hypothetical protein [Acidobacteriota bacterium]
MFKPGITIAIALGAVAPIYAQSKKGWSSAATPVDATVSQIHDRRTTTMFSQLSISLELAGTKASDVSAARVTVIKAIDDTGRDLIDREASPPAFSSTTGSYIRADAATGPASIDLTLLNPTRDATRLTELRGEVELYMPTKDSGAVATLPKFTALAGKPVANKALKASGVEISVLSPALLEAEKKKASKARAEQLKKEGSDAETIKWMIESFESSFLTPEEGEVVLKVKDPGKTIHEFSFLDGAGESQRVYARESDGLTVLSTYGATPAADWALKIALRTPKSMARRSFAVKNIELP